MTDKQVSIRKTELRPFSHEALVSMLANLEASTAEVTAQLTAERDHWHASWEDGARDARDAARAERDAAYAALREIVANYPGAEAILRSRAVKVL